MSNRIKNIYNLHKKAFDSKITNDFFIDYPEMLKENRFYHPSYTPQIIEINKVRFTEDDNFSGSEQHQDIMFEEIQKRISRPKK